MINYLILAFKGIAMGAANVIPGVSGGTIALIVQIFERLINAVKSFNLKAAKLLLSGNIKGFMAHTDFKFLIAVFAGVIVAVLSIARLFDYLFNTYPVYIWAFFFGLILASVYFVGKRVEKWTSAVIIMFVIGTAAATAISLLNPATENSSFTYLFICGIVATCSMILPGLSGSFVLILMGNYKLVMIDAVNDFNITVLLPVALGAVAGLIAFSHLLSWIFKKFRDQTIAILSGFILGSLSILWPWQRISYLHDLAGNTVMKKGQPVIAGFEKYVPDTFSREVFIASLLIAAGILIIWAIEKAVEIKDK